MLAMSDQLKQMQQDFDKKAVELTESQNKINILEAAAQVLESEKISNESKYQENLAKEAAIRANSEKENQEKISELEEARASLSEEFS